MIQKRIISYSNNRQSIYKYCKRNHKLNPNHLLPYNYKQREYIESNGIQYIDTDYIPNNNTKIELSIMKKDNSKSLFGIINDNLMLDQIYNIVITNNKIYVNNDEIINNSEILLSTDTLLLIENFIGRLYYCKIWNNEILNKHFIPSTNSLNKVGLFDMISHDFYTNINNLETEFVAGPVIPVAIDLGRYTC